MKKTVRRAALVVAVAAVAVSAGAAFASGAPAHGGAHDAPHINWKEIGWHAANLFLFLVGLVVLLRKPLASFLSARRAAIAEGLEEAARLRTEAAAKLQDLEARLANLAAERDRILASYREEGERERVRLVELARATAEALRRDGKLMLEQDTRALRRKVRERAVEAALTLAEQIITAELNAQDRVRLADEYIDQLPSAVATSGAGAR